MITNDRWAHRFRTLKSAESYLNAFCPTGYMIYDGNGDKLGNYYLIGTHCKSIHDKIKYI